jgi:sec-independent protein translocase protein TatA
MPLLAPLGLGPLEIGLILVIIVIVFGVGRLPEVGGAIGKGIREFRKSSREDDEPGPPEGAVPMGGSVAAPPDQASDAAPSAPDTIFCAECGAKNARSSKFCSECGHALGAAVG